MYRIKTQAYRLVASQLIFVTVAALLFCVLSKQAGYSVLLGGLCCVLPSAYFARQLFHYLGARYAKQALRAFYWGEVVKLSLVGLMSLLTFKFAHVIPGYFFVGFAFAQLAFWLMPSFLMKTAAVRGAHE